MITQHDLPEVETFNELMTRIAARPSLNQYQRWFEVERNAPSGRTIRNIFRVTEVVPTGLTLLYSMDILQKNNQAFMARPVLEIHSLDRPLVKGQGSHAFCKHTSIPAGAGAWGIMHQKNAFCYYSAFNAIALQIHDSWQQSVNPQQFWGELEDFFHRFASGDFTRQVGIIGQGNQAPARPPKSREELEQELAALLEQGFD
jgi:hypothetical protein